MYFLGRHTRTRPARRPRLEVAEQLGARFGWTAKKKIGMRVGVIADQVATRDDFLHQRGRLPNKFANQEKSCLGVIAVE